MDIGESTEARKIITFIDDIPGVKVKRVEMKRPDANAEMTLVEEASVLQSARWFALQKEQKSKLFVRRCYPTLLQKVKDAWVTPNGFHVLLVGTPGTSKTFFLNYVAYELLSVPREYHVIISHDARNVCVHPDNTITVGQNLKDFDDLLQMYKTVVLYDCSNTNSQPPYMANAKVLAASSPNKLQYKEYTKSFCTTLCMPLWSLDELELCRQSCFESKQVQRQSSQEFVENDPLYTISAEELEKKYNLWGGVIRWTIGAQCIARDEDFYAALEGMNLDVILKAVGSWNQLDFKGKELTHRVIHADTKDMVTFQCTFCSQAACESTIKLLAEEAEQKCKQFLQMATNNSLYASMRGQVFEAYAHRILAKQTSISIRFLDDGKERKDVEIGSRKSMEFEKLDDIGKEDYAIPKSKTFAAVDSLAAPHLAFQMTVSSVHPIVASGLLKILPAIEKEKILVFVVPKEIEGAFEKQQYLTVGKKIMQNVPKAILEIRQAVMAIEF